MMRIVYLLCGGLLAGWSQFSLTRFSRVCECLREIRMPIFNMDRGLSEPTELTRGQPAGVFASLRTHYHYTSSIFL
jgi:hypothetical protein